jgi:DNA-directed RNA polymerase subunit K/omega
MDKEDELYEYPSSDEEEEEESVVSDVDIDNDDDVDIDVDEDVDNDDVDNDAEDDAEQDVEDNEVKEDVDNDNTDVHSDEDEEDEDYLQKFNRDINKNYLLDFHPESLMHNETEISALTTIVRDKENNILDDLHRTIPYLTKYEKTRILGQRAKQINAGAKAFVKVPENTIDGYLIAELELKQKRIPFIIRRPIPGGGVEYWNIKDLEVIDF